jgi:hypothetical protein
VNLSQTWNNVATTFTGELINITDTASNAASLLQDWQVGGVSKAKINKNGEITLSSNGLVTAPTIVFGGRGANYGFFSSGTSSISISLAGVQTHQFWTDGSLYLGGTVAEFKIPSGGWIDWNADTYLYRDAAQTIAQRNGVNAQGFRVYNTYTDASNYERGVFDWQTNANILTIGAKAAGTGTVRPVFFDAASYQWYLSGSSTNGLQMGGGNLNPIADAGVNLGTASNRFNTLTVKSFAKITGAASVIEAWNTDAATSTVNYEKGVFDWATTANVLTIGNAKGGTGNNRSVSLVATGALNLLSNIAASTNTGQQIDVNGNLCPQTTGSTTATGRFICLQSGPGAPTGVPAPSQGVAVYIDTTNSKFYAYIGAAWKGVVLV